MSSEQIEINKVHQEEPKRELVKYEDVQIDVIVDGKGPLIVMLPSFGRGSEDFDEVAAGIASKGFRVLRPQPRGIDRSSGPKKELTLHDFARDVACVIESQGSGGAIIVGHAYGNWIARMTAVNFPNLVRGVVIAAAGAKNYPPELNEYVNKCADMSLPETERLKYLKVTFFAPGNDPSIWLTGWYKEVCESQLHAEMVMKQEEWWSAGNGPLLDLQAAHDPFKPRDKSNELKDELGERVSVVVIPNASHALIPEQPQAVVNAVVAWARQL
ncbi:alpha/beta fold hydrolase [Brevibacillus sp. NRS-1366]|uniref:alpha/beta fold hydrolase n=1 Tax=Brevibacillus sp. NRS-1366 TaxID=3233899 RepID=UPI003D1D6391